MSTDSNSKETITQEQTTVESIEKTFEDQIQISKERYKKKADFKRRSDYYDAYMRYKVNEKTIFYEAFSGRGITCNPAALFNFLLNDERFKDYLHVWSLEKGSFRETIIEQYKDCANVIFVEPNTKKYFRYLSSAKYLINNVTFPNYFIKKQEQIIINTWHGIPMKHLGYDVPNGRTVAANTVRNFLFSDYLLSPAPYMTENFINAHKLENIFTGKILETGYPRIDNTWHVDKQEMAQELSLYGVDYDPGKKVILYAPTFRENMEVDIEEYNQFIKVVGGEIDLSEYQILFKPHQMVYIKLVQQKLLQSNFVPAVVDTNKLLGITDILVSDFSSIFFDFLVTERPVLFYIPDLEEYRETRGLYFEPDELPGPVSDNLQQIGKWIGDIKHYHEFFPYQRYLDTAKRFTSNDDGDVCRRVVDSAFFGTEAYVVPVRKGKTRLLFHTDVCMKNGISSSLSNLLNQLDYSKFDVTFYAIGEESMLLDYYRSLRPEVRVLRRIGARVCNIETDAQIEYCIDRGITGYDNSELFPHEFFAAEYTRCFGQAEFDYIINFAGTSAFWANLYISQKHTRNMIWMHSVMLMEYNRPVNGVYGFRRNLNSIFKLYRYFDACVSCAAVVKDINEKDLEALGFQGNYQYVRNLINADMVREKAITEAQAEFKNRTFLVDRIEADGKMVFVPEPLSEKTTFVTMGRISQEKNFMALVRAFSRLHQNCPETMLYIIGDRDLSRDVHNLIRKLGLTESVIMTGNLDNPFAVMKKCDCFVLPSRHEGQPMVLLEARILNLPIIVSNFPTVADSCYEGGQLIIGMEEDDIYEGLNAFMKGKVPNNYIFDSDRYNADALSEFEIALESANIKWRERHEH